MTIQTVGLDSPTCQPEYMFSPDLFCSGRITGLDITDNGNTITIAPGTAYVKVVDENNIEFLAKVVNFDDVVLTKSNDSDIIIKVPQANVENGAINTDLTAISSIEVVGSGTGGNYHLVLASIDGTGTVSEVANSGHYLPGCDECMRCEDGVLQLPSAKVNDTLTATNIVGGTFTGDASGLTNIPLTGLPYWSESQVGIAQIATANDANTGVDNTLGITPKLMADYAVRRTRIFNGIAFSTSTITIQNYGNTLIKGAIFQCAENGHSTTANVGFLDFFDANSTISDDVNNAELHTSEVYVSDYGNRVTASIGTDRSQLIVNFVMPDPVNDNPTIYNIIIFY